MSSRACAAMIAQIAFTDRAAGAERKPANGAKRTNRRTRRFRRPQAD
ncbi:hypothetical protein BH09ACT7_BH09ACT7_22530 [soil metagenome]